MLRIILYQQNKPLDVKFMDTIRTVLAEGRYSYKLYNCKTMQQIIDALHKNAFCFDILVLDSDEISNCIAICATLRKRNLIASLFFVGGINQIANLFCFRPSGFFSQDINEDLFKRDFLYAVREQQHQNRYLDIKSKDCLLHVKFQNIVCLCSDRRVITIDTASGKQYSFYGKLTEMAQLLPPALFLHCHQSYIVNVDAISLLNKKEKQFILTNNMVIPISKAKYAQSLGFFEHYILRLRNDAPKITFQSPTFTVQ